MICRVWMALAVLLTVIVMMPTIVYGAEDRGRINVAVTSFALLPVLDEGRIKPLDSYARIYLRRFSGREFLDDMRAIDWLADVLFDPEQAAQKPVFRVAGRDLKIMLGMEAAEGRLFSLDDIRAGLEKTASLIPDLMQAQSLTPVQRDLLILHENALTLRLMMDSSAPLIAEDAVAQAMEIIRRSGADPDGLDESERALVGTAFMLDRMRHDGAMNTQFRVVPPAPDSDDALWRGFTAADDPDTRHYQALWRDMIRAYHQGDRALFESAARTAYDTALPFLDGDGHILWVERIYRTLKPFHWSEIFYILTLLAGGAFMMRGQPLFYRLAVLAGAAGIVAHGTGLVMRSLILARPPVGSLYETLLFVGFVMAVIALVVDLCGARRGYVLLCGALAALSLLLVAPVIAPEGDHLEVLVAVLDSNFWLATHVVLMTAGYGMCILTALLAHIYLFRRWRDHSRTFGDLFSLCYRMAVFSLFLTAFGTMLGGIWADQSWGRFWGWDPKENAALFIVLWLVWLMHARLGDYLSAPQIAAGFAFLNVIVALAWFGVNLLGVGLHSYGFISGIAWGLGVFCSVQCAVIGVLWYGAGRARRHNVGTS